MARWHKRLLSAIAATSLIVATGPVATAVGAAEEAVLIPGATVFKQINPLYPILATTYPVIGINFHDDDRPRLVDYSQNALAADHALLDGVEKANVAFRETDGKVVVIGESMGSMVASRLAAQLANSDHAPSTEDVRFVLIAPPEAGIAEYFKEGTFIPILNYRISRVPESPYDTTIVIGEYDGWSDPPDRPGTRFRSQTRCWASPTFMVRRSRPLISPTFPPRTRRSRRTRRTALSPLISFRPRTSR